MFILLVYIQNLDLNYRANIKYYFGLLTRQLYTHRSTNMNLEKKKKSHPFVNGVFVNKDYVTEYDTFTSNVCISENQIKI